MHRIPYRYLIRKKQTRERNIRASATLLVFFVNLRCFVNYHFHDYGIITLRSVGSPSKSYSHNIISVMEEKHQHQQDCNGNQGGGEDASTPLTICNKKQSSEENKTQEERTMDHHHHHHHSSNQSCTTDEQKLKLIVRSQYWGRILKGRTCRNVYTYMNIKAPRVVSSQAVLYNTDGFWGCCPNHGKRVLELQEYHFSDVCEGYGWDLYLVGTWVSPSQSIHDFFLLPQNQTTVDINRNVLLNGWSYVGTCTADGIQSGIDVMLRNLLEENNSYGRRYHHVHIDIMMDQAFDRETPRSRKLNNEKARAERKDSNSNMKSSPINCEQHESSVTTDGTASTEQALSEQESPPSTVSKASNSNRPFVMKQIGAPPIPRLISNDTSIVSGPYPVPMPHSMENPAIAYRDAGWMGETSYWNHAQATVSSRSSSIGGRSGPVRSGSGHQGMHWHPGKGMPLAGGLPQQQQHQQQQSYWQHMHKVPFTTGVPHPPYPLPDMHMHHHHQTMSHSGIQHTYHPQSAMASEMQQYNMMFSENHIDQLQPFQHQHYHHHPPAFLPSDIDADATVTASGGYPYTDPCVDPCMSGRATTNTILQPSTTSFTTSDDSGFPTSPSGLSSSPLPSKLLDTTRVSPNAAAAELPSITSTDSGLSSSPSS